MSISSKEEKSPPVIGVKEASEISGFSSSLLREILSRNIIEGLGVVIPPKYKGGYKSYRIFRNKLLEATGLIQKAVNEEEQKER